MMRRTELGSEMMVFNSKLTLLIAQELRTKEEEEEKKKKEEEEEATVSIQRTPRSKVFLVNLIGQRLKKYSKKTGSQLKILDTSKVRTNMQ
jgi:formylmethanofuran dehydrogenase subunit E